MKKSTKILTISILILAMVLLITKGATYARYASNKVWNYYLEAKEFYLSSDYLDITAIDNVDNNWDGKEIRFNIKNSNQSLITDYDIKYKVVCTTNHPNVICKVNGGESNIFNGTLSSIKKCVNHIDSTDVSNLNSTNCELGGYSWEKVEAIKDLYFDLSSEVEFESATVNISVTSTSPYKKTIEGNFILKKDKSLNGSINTQYNNYADYDRLIISNNYTTNKCVSVSWDSTKLLIDTPVNNIKKSETDLNGYINRIILEMSSKDSTSFKFYKIDELIHSSEDFTFMEIECQN